MIVSEANYQNSIKIIGQVANTGMVGISIFLKITLMFIQLRWLLVSFIKINHIQFGCFKTLMVGIILMIKCMGQHESTISSLMKVNYVESGIRLKSKFDGLKMIRDISEFGSMGYKK